MMRMPSKEEIEALRREYPAGTRVELLHMSDVQAPPAGTLGTVLAVDDVGDLIMQWDNGSGLNVVPTVDSVRKLIMTDKVFRSLMAIRAGGKSNMLDYRTVQRLAYEAGYYELVMYIEEHTKEYIHFIMYGTEESSDCSYRKRGD